MQRIQIRPLQRQAVIVIKQPAVEPGDFGQTKPAAALHRGKQFAGAIHEPVSYTHLDVYKRQTWPWALAK